MTGTGSVVTLASTGVTSALTGSAGVLAVVPDDAEAGAEELELVREAESEADADAAVVGAADELSLDAD